MDALENRTQRDNESSEGVAISITMQCNVWVGNMAPEVADGPLLPFLVNRKNKIPSHTIYWQAIMTTMTLASPMTQPITIRNNTTPNTNDNNHYTNCRVILEVDQTSRSANLLERERTRVAIEL